MSSSKNGLFHSLITGLNPLGDFMEKQNLLEIALKNKATYERRVNEAARLVGQRYWALKQLQDKGQLSPRLKAAHQEWRQSFLDYLGYTREKGFAPQYQELMDGAGVPMWRSQRHTVGLLDISTPQWEDFELDTPFELGTLPEVECKTRVVRKVTLPEVADSLLRSGGGFTHVLVLTSTHLTWFSADVVTLGSCLQGTLEDIFLPDEEMRLAFIDFVMGEESFCAVAAEEWEGGEPNPGTDLEAGAGEEEDLDSEDDLSGTQGGSGPIKTTRAQSFLQEDLESKRRITEELHKQVTMALEILVNHRLSLQPLPRAPKAASELSQAIFKDGLFFVYRILFILFAESKGILRLTLKEYARFYSMESLLDWCDSYPRNVRLGRVEAQGNAIWNSLTAIFTLLRRGVDLKGEGRIPAFNGQLFSPDQCVLFDHGPALTDAVLVQVLRHLTTRQVNGGLERVHFANLEIGQLGVVYEALLAQRPKFLSEDHAWVEAHGGGLGLVPKSWVKAWGGTLEYTVVDTPALSQEERKLAKGVLSPHLFKRFDDMIHPARPARNPQKGVFVICPSGGAKRQTASFYTPKKLADYLTHRTLKPLLEAARTPEEVLAITVLEPSVGCGAFLVSSMNLLAKTFLDRVARDPRPHVKVAGVTFSKAQKDDASQKAEANRLVLENCLYGVDTNPLSLELCRVILYLESLSSQRPLPFLHHKLKLGNALMGADLRGRFSHTFGSGKAATALNWAFVPSMEVFKTQSEFLKEKNNDPSIYGAYAQAATLHGQKTPSPEAALAALKKAEEGQKSARKELFDGKKGEETPTPAFVSWCEKQQAHILHLLAEVASLEERFAKLQQESGGVDRQNDLFRDFASMLPESDPLLMEAEGVPVSPELQHMRKEALEREFGAKVYATLVQGARATQRLRAFAHYACALQTWPLDLMGKFPPFGDYRATAEILLSADLKKPLALGALSKSQFASLRAALEIAKRLCFFHADLEFASIMEKGFGAILGNPPWKVVGAKDKGVFPAFDPGFMSAAASKKRERRSQLQQLTPGMEEAWWQANQSMKATGRFWQDTKEGRGVPLLGYQFGEGQLDLCTLFLLRAEGLLREKGSIGCIVSHSATFITKNTKSLREHFFGAWNLREATVFENRAKIFDIDSRVTFCTLVGSPHGARKSATPQFIQGVTALGDLDSCSASFDEAKVQQPLHEKINIGKSLIERVFSPDVFAIPLIKDPREVKLAEELLRPRPGLVKLGEVLEVIAGVHSTQGPKSGLSLYREDLTKKGYKVPTFEQMFDPHAPLVPLYKGSFFNHFDPYYLGFGQDQLYHDLESKKRAWAQQFEQFGVRKTLNENEKIKRFLDSEKIAWRGISSSTNQRTLIVSVLGKGQYSDHSVYLVIPRGKSKIPFILANMSSLVVDFFSRYQVTSNVTSGIVLSLSILEAESPHLLRAAKLVRDLQTAASLEKKIAFEGEMILHFGADSSSILPEDLIAVFQNRFAALTRAEPTFFPLLLSYLQDRWGERRKAA